jgi:hypothetical protein
VLYRNEGDGRFVDVTREAGVYLETPRYALAVATADFDDDGFQDIFVANDSVENSLWRNRGDGTFVDVAVQTMCALNADGRAQAGMGVDFGDYDGDGWLDIATTSFSHDLNTIFRSVSGEFFLDVSAASGLGVTAMELSWGVGFRDFDLDGDLDLFVANGHIYPEVDTQPLGTSYRQINDLFENVGGGKFEERSHSAGPGFAVARSYRGAAFADYDADGDMDAVVTALDDPILLLENESVRSGHYIVIHLEGTRSNRDGVGARVMLTAGGRTQLRERIGGGSYLCASAPDLHFGLGDADVVERIDVQWPSGLRTGLRGVAANRAIRIVEGEARPVPIQAVRR